MKKFRKIIIQDSIFDKQEFTDIHKAAVYLRKILLDRKSWKITISDERGVGARLLGTLRGYNLKEHENYIKECINGVRYI